MTKKYKTFRPYPKSPSLRASGRRSRRVLELLAEERASVSSVTEPDRAWRVHVADSLTGLEVAELREAGESPILALELGFRALCWQSRCPIPRSI